MSKINIAAFCGFHFFGISTTSRVKKPIIKYNIIRKKIIWPFNLLFLACLNVSGNNFRILSLSIAKLELIDLLQLIYVSNMQTNNLMQLLYQPVRTYTLKHQLHNSTELKLLTFLQFLLRQQNLI